MAVEAGGGGSRPGYDRNGRRIPGLPGVTPGVPAPKPPVRAPVAAPPRKAAPASRGRRPVFGPNAPTSTPQAGMVGSAGTNEILDQRIRLLMAAAPGRIAVNSSFRTRAEQQRLYDLYKAGKGNLAAKPGTGNHEKGLAFDLGYESAATRKWVLANAANFGLAFPIGSEPWHAEPVEIRGGKLSAGAIARNVPPLDGKAAAQQSPPGQLGGPGSGGIAPVAGIPSGVSGTDPSSFLGPDGKVDPQKAIEAFGFIAELAKSVPDIQKVLTQAIENGWTPERFTAAIQSTPWYKTTSQAQRQTELLKKTNPGEYRRQLGVMTDNITVIGRNLGVTEDRKRSTRLAEKAIAMGWSQDEIQRYVAADVKVKATGNTGATAVTVDSLKEQAADYAVPLSDQTLQQWTTQILRGMVPAEAFGSYLKEQAKSLFPGLSKAIDSGVTVAQYTDPYRQIVAQTLEVNPNDVKISDPRIQKALFAQTKDGQRTSMNLSEYREYLRGLPEFTKTRQAQEQAAGFTERITQLFGATG